MMIDMVKYNSFALTITVNQQRRGEIFGQINSLILIDDKAQP